MPRRLLLSLISSVLLAAGEEPRLPPDVEEAIGLARSLPAELAADALIRIAQFPSLARTKRRTELLEDAFVLAQRAREPRMLRLPVGAAPDTPDAVRVRAVEGGLDSLSLQVRVLRALHRKDWIERIVNEAPPLLTCADVAYWDTSAYWELLADWKIDPPRPIGSPLEIRPVLEMIRKRDEAFERLSHWLLDGLEKLSADDRAFSLTLLTAPRDLENLAVLHGRKQLPASPVLNALSRYLTRHLSAPRCRAGFDSTQPAISGFVWYFNEKLRHGAETLAPIREEETRPASLIDADVAKPLAWWEEYQKLSKSTDAAEILNSRLRDDHPPVWLLLAKPHLPLYRLLEKAR